MKSKLFAISTLILSLLIAIIFSTTTEARTLTKRQKKTANRIAKIATDNYEKYGVLPTVAVVQAGNESSFGKNCSGYNMWGIKSGAEQYSSLEEGTMRYLRVINMDYYKGATDTKNYKKQLRRILDGGYCQPEGEYYKDCIRLIKDYNLDKYDKQMFKEIKKKKQIKRKKKEERRKRKLEEKRKKEWNKNYKIVYNSNIPQHAVSVDTNIIRMGSVSIWFQNELQGIYDIQGGQKGNIIVTGNKN